MTELTQSQSQPDRDALCIGSRHHTTQATVAAGNFGEQNMTKTQKAQEKIRKAYASVRGKNDLVGWRNKKRQSGSFGVSAVLRKPEAR
jgi:hypothetical protein